MPIRAPQAAGGEEELEGGACDHQGVRVGGPQVGHGRDGADKAQPAPG